MVWMVGVLDIDLSLEVLLCCVCFAGYIRVAYLVYLVVWRVGGCGTWCCLVCGVFVDYPGGLNWIISFFWVLVSGFGRLLFGVVLIYV